MKKCSCCKQTKPFSEFYKKKQSKDGYDFWCKSCWKQKAKRKTSRSYSEKSEYFTSKQLCSLVDNCKRRASIKNLDYTLSTREVSSLVNTFCSTHYHIWAPYHPFKPSIDRIDSKKGYTPDNIQVVWMIENHCKNIYTNEQVLEFCKRKLQLV